MASLPSQSATQASTFTRDEAESFLPVTTPAQAAPAQAIATHGLVDVAALDVKTAK
jgi:hypothetical protein